MTSLSTPREITVPGGEGRAMEVFAGEYLSVIDLEGSQVVDFVAVQRDDPHQFVSVQQTRSTLGRWTLEVGDQLVTNRREPLLELVYDDVGVHDLLISACNPALYEQRFGITEHRSCRENLTEALEPWDVEEWWLPDPLNIFMHFVAHEDGRVEAKPTPSKSGDQVTFRCLVDTVVAVSACPFDLGIIHGEAVTPVQLVVSDSVDLP